MRSQNYIVITLAAAAFCWTAGAETSDPTIAARHLPPEIRGDCALQTTNELNVSCNSETDFRSRWVARSPHGDLFAVMGAAPCSDTSGCRAWLVEKRANAATVLLELDGPFSLHRGVKGYPTLKTRTELSATHTRYTRYEWRGDSYVRAETKLMYRVDGFECASPAECGSAAHEALSQEHTDRAVQIWQNVHGVAWI